MGTQIISTGTITKIIEENHMDIGMDTITEIIGENHMDIDLNIGSGTITKKIRIDKDHDRDHIIMIAVETKSIEEIVIDQYLEIEIIECIARCTDKSKMNQKRAN